LRPRRGRYAAKPRLKVAVRVIPMRSIRAKLGRFDEEKLSSGKRALVSEAASRSARTMGSIRTLLSRGPSQKTSATPRPQNPSCLPFVAGTSFNQQAKRAAIGIISGKLQPGAQYLIDDDTELHVDQIVVGVNKECRPLVAPGHCAAGLDGETNIAQPRWRRPCRVVEGPDRER
jgi:hypothetical protein